MNLVQSLERTFDQRLLSNGISWCSLGVEWSILRPILAYLVDLGSIMILTVSFCLKRICVNGRYRTRTCDLTGVMVIDPGYPESYLTKQKY